MGRRWIAPLVALSLIALRAASAELQDLDCKDGPELKQQGIFWACDNYGTVKAKENTTFHLRVEPPAASYQQYDINITLTSLTGDADLIVATPGSQTNLASTRNVGQDIVFVYRTELAAGTYSVVVLGYALDTQYELTVTLVETMRSLRPAATLALGKIMVECCAKETSACTEMKALYPQLSSADPDVNPDYCYMHGNVCSMDGKMLELGAFAGADLACAFPGVDTLGVMTYLRRLDLSGNGRITGNITTVAKTLKSLPNLAYVDLGFDSIEGPLESACPLATTKKLESLNLMNNGLSGSIPACITQLPALAELHLDYNQLTGTLPASIPTSSPLTYLTAAYQLGFLSGISGPVPTALGKLKNLAYLDLGGNMLTGSLPRTLPASMIDLRLSANFLTGTVPASYGLMKNLVSMELDHNSLTGTLPPSLTEISALKLLDLSSNGLTGSLPASWEGTPSLTLLLLSNNAFSGTLPPGLSNPNDLVVLDLHSNQLSGTLSDFAFAAATNREDIHSTLRYLDLGNNSFSGDLNDAEGLKRLAVFSNFAPLAPTLDDVQRMAANTTGSTIRARAQMTPRTFDISSNAFTGEFPGWLVEYLAECKEDVTVVLDGDKLVCPKIGFFLDEQPPKGRLDGLFCYMAPTSMQVTDATPMANVTSMVHFRHFKLSGGAIFGIVVAVLVAVAALAGLGYWLYKRRAALGGSFNRFDKFDSGAPVPMQSATSATGFTTSKFGGGRMVYPDMQEVEMGDEPASKGYSVNLKGGKRLDLP